MALMSEGKSGPSRTKMRALWRKYKAETDALQALELRPNTMADDSLRILTGWTSGKSTPVGLIPAAWRDVCEEMNQPDPEEPTR